MLGTRGSVGRTYNKSYLTTMLMFAAGRIGKRQWQMSLGLE
jgi:hypothetical protein